ncbi:MAG TPA: hemolysin family protein [Limnochordia bacterium]|nr:hemolysin family protein [Limnochordia bacterium]
MSMAATELPFLAAVLFLLVVASGISAAVEASASRSQERRLEELIASGVDRAEAALRAGKELGAKIEAARFLGMVSAILLGWLGAPPLYQALSGVLAPVLSPALSRALSAALALVLLLLVQLVFGQLVPQRLMSQAESPAPRFLEQLALWIGRLFSPVIVLTHALAQGLVMLLGGRRLGAKGEFTHGSLELIALRSWSKGPYGATQREILKRYFAFEEKTVGELMVPRQDVAALPSSMRMREAKDAARQLGFTRYPVFDGERQRVIGIVHFRDLIDAADATPRAPVTDAMQAAVTLSTRTPASEALRAMRAGGSHLAVVVDDHGEAVGIVTVEDILAELVLEGSEGQGTSEALPPSVQLAPGLWELDSQLLVQEVEDLLDVDLDDAGLQTIGSYVFSRLGRKPKLGDSVKVDGFIFEVIAVHGARVRRLRVQRTREAPPSAAPAAPAKPPSD